MTKLNDAYKVLKQTLEAGALKDQPPVRHMAKITILDVAIEHVKNLTTMLSSHPEELGGKGEQSTEDTPSLASAPTPAPATSTLDEPAAPTFLLTSSDTPEAVNVGLQAWAVGRSPTSALSQRGPASVGREAVRQAEVNIHLAQAAAPGPSANHASVIASLQDEVAALRDALHRSETDKKQLLTFKETHLALERKVVGETSKNSCSTATTN